jgi:hypothetical protein
MALATDDTLVYDGSAWNNQPSTDGAADLAGPLGVDGQTFYVLPRSEPVLVHNGSDARRTGDREPRVVLEAD